LAVFQVAVGRQIRRCSWPKLYRLKNYTSLLFGGRNLAVKIGSSAAIQVYLKEYSVSFWYQFVEFREAQVDRVGPPS
jgi:hypothetical protein